MAGTITYLLGLRANGLIKRLSFSKPSWGSLDNELGTPCILCIISLAINTVSEQNRPPLKTKRKNIMAIADDIEEVGTGFNKHFGMQSRQFKTFMDEMMTIITKNFSLDIIKFDDWLHQQRYIEKKHGSMRDYILKTYGKEAIDFIEDLLK